MLADIHRCLSHSGGLLLLAIVFPLCQYVEFKTGHKPEETLTVEGNCFEHQLVSFEQNVLKPSGFQVIRWSKLPYLCEGNLDLTYFYLIDSVFLLQPVNLGQPVWPTFCHIHLCHSTTYSPPPESWFIQPTTWAKTISPLLVLSITVLF